MKKKTHKEFIEELKNKGIEYNFISEYTGAHDLLLVQGKYGVCQLASGALLKNTRLEVRNAVNPTEYFINHCKDIHNDKYDYSLVNYTVTNSYIKIICSEHGEFQQKAYAHLSKKHGCPECAKINNKFGGYSYTEWEEAGLRSKNFTGYKLYIIKCYNDEESFYKIGKTFVDLEKRFPRFDRMPYKYKVMETIDSSARNICILEHNLQVQNKNFQYFPALDFHGKFECFSKIQFGKTIAYQ